MTSTTSLRGLASAIAILGFAAAARGDVEKRPVPDYDGRGDEPTTAGDVLIWVPRVALSPLYVVSEYVVRRPMGWLLVSAEKGHWPHKVAHYLRGRIGIIPTGLVDTGLRPTGGFYFWWNDAVVDRNQLRVTASAGPGVVTATLLDRFSLGDRGQLALRGALSRRGDVLFNGVGPDADLDDEARYEDHRVEASASATLRLGGLSGLRLEAGLRSVDFADDRCCGQPSVGEAAAMGLFELPPGYAEGGYDGPFTRLTLVLDSRRAAPATGVALALDAEQGSDTSTDRVWLRASATLSGSLELGQRRRVASLVLHGALAEPIEGDDVPFTELASLGGSGPLPGFIAGRLLGRSALAATLQYEWPVWAYLTGVFHAGTGAILGDDFEGFEAGRLRGSAGMGIRSAGLGDHRFELQVALGTQRFDDGGGIDSVRVVFGGVIGF